MHPYRSHNCGEIRPAHVGQTVRLSGWVHRVRDHGGLLFIDLRDHYGISQIVADPDSPVFVQAEEVRAEWVIRVDGEVKARTPETTNKDLPTGAVEIFAADMEVLSTAGELPVPVFGDLEYPEETRLKYRFLDLRRERIHNNIVLRSKIITSLRNRMTGQGFTEFQTPILTASSPEGARDFLVPSRVHPGKFYALPQAPQQFKQLIMVSGFDRYFQIAPCFRDEDARADRSPGEFYQLDIEMSFVTQEDVFAAVEPVLHGVFQEFADGRTVPDEAFPRIPYAEAMAKYGTDKPDLRNPIEMSDVTGTFRGSGFKVFAGMIEKDDKVRVWAIPAPGGGSRAFCDRMNGWAQKEDQPGLGYIIWRSTSEDYNNLIKERNNLWSRYAPEIKLPQPRAEYENKLKQMDDKLDELEENIKNSAFDIEGAGPVAKNIGPEKSEAIRKQLGLRAGDAVFFAAGRPANFAAFAAAARQKVAADLNLVEKDIFRFCWIVDFPLYEWNEDEKRIDFSHNPFSMPQGGLEALEQKDPLDILGLQYDIVCNGVELSSGAIRNHRPDIMLKAFEIAGYGADVVEDKFGGMLNAFRFGAPPHGGIAPGVDRIVMLLADEPNIREVILFPMNQRAEDLMMGAPAEVSPAHLRELHLRLNLPED